ncbi:uncharacterized protein LOC132706346 [Cylas formicarius]|uniref:uncharacterized protein LOC132706346 n=1 Tax=Cylas formicarius TaxID=197179 RepID=UPI002958C40F|nr:uncharacterized protein LOC132706346 [Cylas formicarius]
MILTGMWRQDPPPFYKSVNFLYRSYSIVLHVILFSIPALMTANLPDLLRSDANSAIEGASKLLYCVILVAKVFSYQSGRSRDLLSRAMEEESRLYSINDEDVIRIYKGHVRYCHLFSKFFFISTMVSSSTLCEIAIINSYKFSKNAEAVGDKPTPLLLWYPFDKNRHHIWVMAHQFLTVMVGNCYASAVYLYYNSIMIYVRGRLQILQHYFRNYKKYVFHESTTTLETLRALCVKHQDLISYINDVNRSFKSTVFLEYSITSAILATVLYQVIEGQDASFNIIFVFIVSSQLMLLAWTSDEIVLQSSNLATALYESTWFEQCHDSKMLIRFMMMGCHKPLSISIGPFGPMTMLSAMSRLKLAYSYVSVMTS